MYTCLLRATESMSNYEMVCGAGHDDKTTSRTRLQTNSIENPLEEWVL
jgi:hypothetical protein